MTKFLEIALPLPLRLSFTYQLPDNFPQPTSGCRVRVPFGKKEKIGFVQAVLQKTEIPLDKIKPILEIIDETPLFDETLYTFLKRAADYYHHPLGEVLAAALPKALRTGQNVPELPYQASTLPDNIEHLTLSDEQQTALDTICKSLNEYIAFLLKGATGTGKTEIYLQAIERILQQGKQALVLIPEIGLTPQTVTRFKERFGECVGTFHSGLTDKARLLTWQKTQSGEYQILIGTRSSLFLPFKKLGMIIVDEEHDPSFKQQTGFRYSARDLAIYRAHQVECPIILGSATPSFESLLNVDRGRYQLLTLTKRLNQAKFPAIHIMDVRHKQLTGGLAAPLIENISTHLERQQQVLIFLNRRGYAPTWMCFECQWQAACQRCQARLTYHRIEQYLRCPHCEYFTKVPTACPECHAEELHPVGIGTQRIEETLAEHFPDTPITRLDSDATRGKDRLSEKLDIILSGTPQIILGTQMLAKGHHFPNVTLAAILDADGGLFSSDFRGAERMGQLITQVAGRAGRGAMQSEVVIQTFHPDHDLLQLLIHEGYDAFSKNLIAERAACHLPPFAYLALVRAESLDAHHPESFLKDLRQLLHPYLNTDVTAYGPLPAPMPKRQNRYRFQLLFKSAERKPLHQLLARLLPFANQIKSSKRVRWSLDVDPIDIF